MIEECLPEVLGSPQQDAAAADPVACRQRCLALLGQVRREAGPGPVPAVTLPGRTGHWGHDFRAAAHAARTTLLAHPHLIPLLGTRPPVTQPAFTLWESLTSILLDAGLSEERAADGTDCLGRLLIGHALAEAGQPPGGDVGGGEEEHRQAQAALAAARYPALSRVQQANIVHDPRRIFELALDGLILALQAHHPHD